MLEIRTCKVCGFTASLEEFPKGKRKKDGSWYRRHKCKKCYWELKKKYRARILTSMLIRGQILINLFFLL